MASESRINIRLFASSDASALSVLLHEYMREAFEDVWHGSEAGLLQDGLGRRCTVHLALTQDDQLVGFLGWTPSYDLHHCVSGAELLDLYVVPQWRGRGVALLLGCAAAAEIFHSGGHFMKGTVVEPGSGRQLYGRFGVCDAAGCIIGGRAFRRLADLTGCSPREIAQRLPERSWNYEA